MKKITIVKIGGQIIDNPNQLHRVLQDFSTIENLKILVHGGGKAASALSRQMGIEPKMIKGRRITSQKDLEIIQMVYAGLINKTIIATLQAANCNAIGLSGTDGNTIQAVKRPVQNIDYGFVGDISGVNTANINKLLEAGFVPVFCALTHDTKGMLLNTNADTIAAELAAALVEYFEPELIYAFDKTGVLKNLDDEDSLMAELSHEQYIQCQKTKIIHEGMIPKLDNAFNTRRRGVKEISIRHYSQILTEQAGTRIT